MNILILTGSPRPNGNSNFLAERFAEGAKAAGHTVTHLDTAHLDVHPCIACEHCHNGSGTCTFHDGFTDIRRAIAKADALVFAGPIYYFGLPAQLIAAIDRFYACGDDLKFPKKAALIVTLADTNPDTAAAAVLQFRKIADYEGWADGGVLVATGLWSAGDAKNSPYADQAYALGKSF